MPDGEYKTFMNMTINNRELTNITCDNIRTLISKIAPLSIECNDIDYHPSVDNVTVSFDNVMYLDVLCKGYIDKCESIKSCRTLTPSQKATLAGVLPRAYRCLLSVTNIIVFAMEYLNEVDVETTIFDSGTIWILPKKKRAYEMTETERTLTIYSFNKMLDDLLQYLQ